MKQIIFSLLLLISCIITSCDDNTDTPIPASITLLDEKIIIRNGETFELYFRVEPSGYNVDFEKLSLEVVRNSDATNTTDENVGHYRLVAVEKVSEQGEWMATVASDSKSGSPYGETVDLYLILSGGKRATRSGSALTVVNCPPLSDLVLTIHSPYAQSYMTLEVHDEATKREPQLASAYVYARFIEPMVYFYNKNWLSMEVTLDDATAPFVVTNAPDGDKLKFCVTPTEDIFAGMDNKEYIPVKVNIHLSDVFGDEMFRQTEIKFYRSLIVLPAGDEFTYSPSELSDSKRLEEHNLDYSDLLLRLGITSEFLQKHSENAYALAAQSWLVTEGGKKADGLFLGFDDLMALDMKEPNTFKSVQIVDMLYYPWNIPFGTHFASLYLLVTDPYTNSQMIGAEIRQEIKIVND